MKKWFYMKDKNTNENFDVVAGSLDDAKITLVNFLGGSKDDYVERF